MVMLPEYIFDYLSGFSDYIIATLVMFCTPRISFSVVRQKTITRNSQPDASLLHSKIMFLQGSII